MFIIIKSILVALFSYGVSNSLLPFVVQWGNIKHLQEKKDDRKVHVEEVHALGGVGIFITTWLLIMCLPGIPSLGLLLASLLLFITGLVDDLINLSAFVRFGVQILTGIILCQSGWVLYLDFLPFQSFYLVPEMVTIFFFVLLINAYNFIDGINGLAGSLGAFHSLLFGLVFLFLGMPVWGLICFILLGSLLGFLRFNFGKAKIFMGDNGSTFIGLMMGVFSIVFMKEASTLSLAYPFVLVIGILIIPVFDLLKVSFLRIYKGKSPLKADRTHIHHQLLNVGFSNEKICKFLLLLNGLIVWCTLGMLNFSLFFSISMLVMIMSSFYVILEGSSKITSDSVLVSR